MAQHTVVKPKPTTPPKAGTGKKGKKDVKKKATAGMSLITTQADALALPLGALVESTSRIDLNHKSFVYDVQPWEPESGKHAGEKLVKVRFTTPDGKVHLIHYELAIALGWKIRTEPIFAVQLIAAEQEMCPQAA